MQAFVVQTLAFVLLVIIFVKFAGPVLKKTLRDRSKSIEDAFQKIEKETAETKAQLEEYEKRLAAINVEAQARLKKILDEAERTRTQLLSDAQAQARAALEKARREAQIERDKAVLELREEAASLTLRAAEQLVQSAMNDSLHNQMVDKTLANLDSVKKA